VPKNKGIEFFKKHKFLFIAAAIILLGFFLRAYSFSDWLHFELDQSRDARIISAAVEDGAGNLPLLGPKAAGSFLRLGPIFYYFNYVSALAFGNTPAGMAFLIMLFGVLAMPVFYFFVRQYFEKNISLILLLLFSTSLFLVMYSRFSWNPNSLPLFILLSFLSLLKMAEADGKRKGIWLLILAFSAGIATQLHFLAMVSVPVISIIFLLLKRPRVSFAYWTGAILIVMFLYSPAIINDIKTGGKNIGQLTEVASEKSSRESGSLLEKVSRSYAENSIAHLLLLTGQRKAELPKLKQSENFSEIDIVCDQSCRDRLPLGAVGLLFFSAGLILLARNIFRSEKGSKKDFLILSAIWISVMFALFVPLSSKLAPRFFLLIAGVPFIFAGFMLEFLKDKLKTDIFRITAFIAVSLIVFSNLSETKERFAELASAPDVAFKTDTDRILKENYRVTLFQQNVIMDHIEAIYRENNYPVYLLSSPHYRRSFLYHLDQRDIPRGTGFSANSSETYAKGNYFLILPALSNIEKELAKFEARYNITDREEFGTLTFFRIVPKIEAITSDEQIIKIKETGDSAPGVPKRFIWNEVFGQKSVSVDIDAEEEPEDEDENNSF